MDPSLDVIAEDAEDEPMSAAPSTKPHSHGEDRGSHHSASLRRSRSRRSSSCSGFHGAEELHDGSITTTTLTSDRPLNLER